ncbi:alanine racemase [Paenibacillus qinlingensis]|uniref:D-serine deaminase-like pyridoxal phosphate-dependent protein n=1 Tax=Paenibacillus qinlingensis TaxID=1837343 RepID=A0ABU1NSN9_9BACL|nr:alanine racemase [Paenibacillus qinlingensis]MDR6550497.1 D-serine deaminase-like pyridoxal phosphate-dependent protein [Paenibacillus qinlingensis]
MNDATWPTDMDTPAIVIDLDRLDANLQSTAELAAKAGVRLRPHTKTHKSIWIAQEQLRHGASGITVAKLGEAEVMAAGGIDDILIAYPLVGRLKLERLGRLLQQQTQVSVSVDSYEVAKGLSDLGEHLQLRVPLYLDVNSGLNRCGKEPGEETAALAVQIAKLPGIRLSALMTHAGQAYSKSRADDCLEVALAEAEALLESQRVLRRLGVDVPDISVGSTPTSKFIGALAGLGVTEMRPGAYVFGDGSQLYTGLIGEEACAMRIYATVVSTPRQGTVIIDAGSKTLSNDSSAHRKGYGFIPENPAIFVERLNEEHGILSVPDGTDLQIGDIVEIIPNHCCAVTNLHDRLLGVRGGQLERILTVDARGKVT